jgi:hypothetical protein
MQNENQTKVELVLLLPSLFFSVSCMFCHSQTPSFKTPFKNPINKNNEFKKQIATTNVRIENSKLKRKVHIIRKSNKIKALCLGLGLVPLKKKSKFFVATCN